MGSAGRSPEDRETRYRAAEARLWRSLGVRPTEHRIRLAHAGIDVRVQEAGTGPPAIFLHGASTSGTSWAGLVAALPDVRCLLVDRPGTGLSDALKPDSRSLVGILALADDLVADTLVGLGLESATVISTSFGGLFAFRAAMAHPTRVERIVEFGWTVGARPGRMPVAMRLGSLPVLGSLASRLPANERLVRAMFRSIGLRESVDGGLLTSEAIAAYAGLLNHTDTLRNELALSRSVASPLRGLDPRLLLSDPERASIAIPVRFIWGEHDSFGGPDIGREFAEPFPNARLDVVPGAGHSPWMDDPTGAAARVRMILAEGSDAILASARGAPVAE